DPARLQPRPLARGGKGRGLGPAHRRTHLGEPVDGLWPIDRPRKHRRPVLRATGTSARRTQETSMTDEDPLTPRPAATVMLIRDTAEGIKVFLMRRHS